MNVESETKLWLFPRRSDPANFENLPAQRIFLPKNPTEGGQEDSFGRKIFPNLGAANRSADGRSQVQPHILRARSRAVSQVGLHVVVVADEIAAQEPAGSVEYNP